MKVSHPVMTLGVSPAGRGSTTTPSPPRGPVGTKRSSWNFQVSPGTNFIKASLK